MISLTEFFNVLIVKLVTYELLSLSDLKNALEKKIATYLRTTSGVVELVLGGRSELKNYVFEFFLII